MGSTPDDLTGLGTRAFVDKTISSAGGRHAILPTQEDRVGSSITILLGTSKR